MEFTMTWTKKDDGSGPSWVSGIYKITQYECDLANHLGVHYRAYFIRKGDTCWGWHPYPETPWYRTLKGCATGLCHTFEGDACRNSNSPTICSCRKDRDYMKSYPLQWPPGWKRARNRASAKFNQRAASDFNSSRRDRLTIAGGTKRVLQQLRVFGVKEGDAIISTNLRLRLDGLPYSDQKEPDDPGVAVYWKRGKDVTHKVMAIDRYQRIADNLAAIAATLEAMRAIERHGGAVILERAFTGFLALPAPNTWRAVMGWDEDQRVNTLDVKLRYTKLAKEHHPDNGGTDAKMAELNWAKAEAERELS